MSPSLKALPPEVVTATALFSDGDLAPAEEIIRAFLLKHGNHPEAMRLLAKIGMARDVLDDAELLLDAVLTLAPDHRAARYDYAQTLAQRHKYQKAREEIERLLALEPRNPDYRSLAATIAVGLGEQERAIALYRDMCWPTCPTAPDVYLWLGHALKTIGKLPEAIAAYRDAAAARPSFGDAYWSLANLKTYRFDDERDRPPCAPPRKPPPTTLTEDRFHLVFRVGQGAGRPGRECRVPGLITNAATI